MKRGGIQFPVHNATVVIRGDSIECTGRGQQCPLDPDSSIIDATGKWLVPGLVDSHVHWQAWYDEQKVLFTTMISNQAWLQPTLITEHTLIEPGIYRDSRHS